MKETSLFKLSLLCTILGLVALYFFAEEIELPALSSLEGEPIGGTSKIQGRVSQLRQSGNTLYLEVEGLQTIKTDVIFFTAEKPYLQTGDYVDIEGQVEEYKGKTELLAQKVTLRGG
ncbi:hypothetical protein J4437_00115 [Candidatus Woesearchaeota archaeon]|nr:hypothetical protein [Candidatus Woesearchaeota archaeon]